LRITTNRNDIGEQYKDEIGRNTIAAYHKKETENEKTQKISDC